jgi:3-hydroxyisobutyrate dehydrogenase
MIHDDFAPGFPLHHADKDTTLALHAAGRHGIGLPLTEALLRRWDEAISKGHGDEDVAAAITAAR